jgi:hypothetical protein
MDECELEILSGAPLCHRDDGPNEQKQPGHAVPSNQCKPCGSNGGDNEWFIANPPPMKIDALNPPL